MNEQARRSSPPNRVRSPTDRQFASGCSPRRFGPTQLPSATELWHTPARTFTVLMWRPHGRTHSRESGNPGSSPLLYNLVPQIFSIAILLLDQFYFPCSVPLFELFFSGNCRDHTIIQFIIDEPMNTIFLRKAIDGIIPVFVNTFR